jgi:hypothetical protein
MVEAKDTRLPDPSMAMSVWELSRHGQEDNARRQRESSLSQTLVRQLDTGFMVWHEPRGSVDEREPLDTQPDSYAVPFLGSSIFILDRS